MSAYSDLLKELREKNKPARAAGSSYRDLVNSLQQKYPMGSAEAKKAETLSKTSTALESSIKKNENKVKTNRGRSSGLSSKKATAAAEAQLEQDYAKREAQREELLSIDTDRIDDNKTRDRVLASQLKAAQQKAKETGYQSNARAKVSAAKREQQTEAREKVTEINKDRTRVEKLTRYEDKSYDDTLSGQFGANYAVGRLTQDSSLAWSEYLDNPTEKNRKYAEALDATLQQFSTRNFEALDDENVKMSWVSKSLANYLPQFLDQTGYAVKGALVGAVAGTAAAPGVGTVRGIKAGITVSSGVYSYKTMRGAAFKALLESGVDEATAREAASDEAFVSSLIEMADTGVDMLTLGGSTLLNALGKGGWKGISKLVTEWAGQDTAKRFAITAAKYGLNVGSEALEEATQEAVSIANQARAKAGKTSGSLVADATSVFVSALTGKNKEAADQIRQAAAEGAKIAVMMGGADLVTTQATTKVVSTAQAELAGAGIRAAGNELNLLAHAKTDYAKETGTYKLAKSLESKLKATGRVTLTDLETGRLFEQMTRDDAAAQVKVEKEAKAAEKKVTKQPTAETKVDAQTEADLTEMTVSVDQAKAEYAAAQLSNPEVTVVSPVAQKLMTAGVKNDVAVEQAALIQKLQAGHKLTEAETQKLRVSDPAVRAVIESETSVTVTGASKADKRKLTQSIIKSAAEVKAQQERAGQAIAEQQAGQVIVDQARAEAQAAADAVAPATERGVDGTVVTPTETPVVGDSGTNMNVPDGSIQYADGTTQTFEQFAKAYEQRHPSAKASTVVKKFHEYQLQNQMGQPIPGSAKKQTKKAATKTKTAESSKASVGDIDAAPATVRFFGGKQLSEEAAVEAVRLEQESLKKFGKFLGVEVEFQEFEGADAEANGFYLKDENKVVLNSKKLSGLRHTTRIFLHEVTHPAQDADVNLTKDILNLVKEVRGEEYLNMLIKRTKDAYVAFYKKNGYDLGKLNVASEVAADYMMNIFESRAALDRIAGVKPSLVGKLFRRLGVIRQATGLDASVTSHLDKLADRMVEAQQKAKEQKSTAQKDSAEKQYVVGTAAERAARYTYDSLVKKPDMKVVAVGDAQGLSKAQVVSDAKKNAAKIGSVNPKDGSVSVHVKDIGADVILATNGLKHGFDRRFADLAPVTLVAGEVLQNSIRINELTPQKANAEASYVLIGAAKSEKGEPIIVRSVVNRFSNELTSMDVLYAIHAKKESAALLPRLAGDPAIRTDSTISIAALLEYVNQYFPDVLPESVLKHFGRDARPAGVLGKDALFSVDSEGNQLSTEQLEFFAESKVRDKDGKLMPVNPELRKYSINPDTGYEKDSIQDKVLTLLKSGSWEDAMAQLQNLVDDLGQKEPELSPDEKMFRDVLTGRKPVTEADKGKNRQKLDDLIEDFGAHQPGEKPARPVIIPKGVAEGRGVSKHVRTVLEAEHTPEWFVAEVERLVAENAEGYTYDIATDRAAMNHVESKKGRDFQRNLAEWEDVFNSERITKNDIALGEFLYTEAVKAGDIATATRLVAELSAAGTRAGQTVQAMSLLKKMTPSGQLYYLQKAVEKLNKDLEKQGKTPNIEIDADLAADLLDAETAEEMQAAMEALLQDIANKAPVTVMDKWNTWRYLAMLGNPRTHIRNVASNAVFSPAIFLKDVVGAVTQNLAGSKLSAEEHTKNLREIGESFLYGFSGGKRTSSPYVAFADADFDSMADVLRGGGKQNPADLIRDKRPIFKSKATQWINTASKVNSQWMENEDGIFLKWHYVRALSQYLAAQNADLDSLMTTPDGRNQLIRAREWAVQEAQKATFRDASAFASALSRFEQSNKAAGVLVGGLLPFKKTPINILKRGVEYSPLGVISMVRDGLKHKQSAARFVDRLAASLTGTGIMALGLYLAAQGLLRGSGSSDDKEKEFEELQGAQNYALQLSDGTSFTIDWMAPSALPLFVGCEINKILNSEGKFTAADLADTLSLLAEPMFNLSMLDGLNSTLKSAGYSDSPLTSVGTSILTGYVGQAVPTLLGQVARTIDGTRRTTYIDKNKNTVDWLDRTVQYNMTKVPGASQSLTPKLDAWGRPDTQSSFIQGALENFLSPGYVSGKKTSPMEEELLRLYKATGEASVLPKAAPKYFSVGGQRYDLNGEEWTSVQTLMGQSAYAMLTNLVNSQAFQKLTDAEKLDVIEDVYTFARERAKAAVLPDYTPNTKWIRAALEQANNGYSVEDYILKRSR